MHYLPSTLAVRTNELSTRSQCLLVSEVLHMIVMFDHKRISDFFKLGSVHYDMLIKAVERRVSEFLAEVVF